jgi:acyl-CoA thioesterase I
MLVILGKAAMKVNFVKIVWLIMIPFVVFISCNNSEKPSAEPIQAESGKNNIPDTISGKKKVILFFGNSITAGYGLEVTDYFTTLIQQRIDSLGYKYEVVNAGVSGETTASGSNRVNWVIEKQAVDVFVLELGANDGLRGLPVRETRKNLELIIDRVREVHPEVKIILAGMMVPPSMGSEYSKEFRSIFPEIARKKNTYFIPFILNNVGGIDSLNQEDGIHPNAAGEKIVMENVWEILVKVMDEERSFQ